MQNQKDVFWHFFADGEEKLQIQIWRRVMVVIGQIITMFKKSPTAHREAETAKAHRG